MKFQLLVLLAAAALSSGCATAPADTNNADVQAVKDTETAWVKDAASKDPEKFLAHYSDDASVLLPNMATLTGKDAIRAAMTPMLSDPNFALTFQARKVEVARSGELAYTQGTYMMSGTNPETKQAAVEKGKYLTIFRKQADGNWKAVADMVSADTAPPAALPTK
jgi:uncharacterized protein (TIGR02246 family)